MVTINPVLNRLRTYPAEALYQKKRVLLAAGKQVFDFSVGDPIEPTDAAIIAAFRQAVPTVSQYPSIGGEADFRLACSEWVRRRFGIALDPETQILPAGGSKEAIFHLPLVFIDPQGARRRVLFGVPGYPVYERGTLFAGGEPWPVELTPESGFELRPWDLPQRDIDRCAIVWANYPHNPTCATVELSYLQRLADFCRERDILLCGDECYVDLYFDEPAPLSLLQCGSEGVLTFHSLSKRSGMTGYRAGFIAGDAALISRLRAARANFGVAPSVMVQGAAAFAWRDETHAQARRSLFRRKRDLFREFFLDVGLECAPCPATLYLWVRTPTAPLAYAERLAEAGIIVTPAPLLGADQPFVRLALVPSEADCQRAIVAWRELME